MKIFWIFLVVSSTSSCA